VKILWLSGSRIAGGAERATVQILALLRDRGYAVAVAAPEAGRLAGLCAEHRLPFRAAALGAVVKPRSWLPTAALLRDVAPDIALATGADEWLWTCLSPRPAQTRLVLARHMALPLSAPLRWLAGYRADALIAVSHAVRTALAGAAIPESRLHVVYNPTRFAPRASLPTAAHRLAARQRLGLPIDGKLVGFFGGADPNKGLADVAAAVRYANRHFGPTHLLLCGRATRGADAPSDMGLGARLHDLGEIDGIEDALTAADAVVMATHSRLSEALPATLIEAMACGTPVLAYATGGMAEVIGADQRAGLLARPDDADDLSRLLLATLSDPVAAAQRAADALQRVRQRYQPSAAADGYERVFTALRTPPSAAASPTP
jgi:glycosyltransferase involved in cell wall biosynthesis